MCECFVCKSFTFQPCYFKVSKILPGATFEHRTPEYPWYDPSQNSKRKKRASYCPFWQTQVVCVQENQLVNKCICLNTIETESFLFKAQLCHNRKKKQPHTTLNFLQAGTSLLLAGDGAPGSRMCCAKNFCQPSGLLMKSEIWAGPQFLTYS